MEFAERGEEVAQALLPAGVGEASRGAAAEFDEAQAGVPELLVELCGASSRIC